MPPISACDVLDSTWDVVERSRLVIENEEVRTMSKKLFRELVASMKQMGEIVRDERKPSRKFRVILRLKRWRAFRLT
jgi:hypothetical protein